ncbi:sugar phosphate isomerase/epimerase family protein [Paenibacillus donghaensis]|uniref:Xylose isomerase-like TIM barrel domain-containing protein n=1 Tax=Paenibacillus donghaensis TaxID=414771 RepID=A0A2Z2KEV6_9BACL|nr:TIM barrel protein [Paenibacillus donghaensis]ASA21643.1 hypothetical protein B9T62_13195 [Paenibacillus donghaensis]
MSKKVSIMVPDFINPIGNKYETDIQYKMLRAVGFDGFEVALWSDEDFIAIENYSRMNDKYELDFSAVVTVADLALGFDHPQNERILHLLESIDNGCIVKIPIQRVAPGVAPSNPKGDAIAINWLNKALEIAERRNITILLYAHIGHWIERHEDAARLCHKIIHPNLGLVFNVIHWFAVSGMNLSQTLQDIAPYLKQVSLTGTRKSPYGTWGVATFEPLYEGELDLLLLLSEVKKVGFRGMYNVMLWGWSGDIISKLERSILILQDNEK